MQMEGQSREGSQAKPQSFPNGGSKAVLPDSGESSTVKNGKPLGRGPVCTGCPAIAKRSWPKRHPVLFWGGLLLILLFVLNVISEIRSKMAPKVAVVRIDDIILSSEATVKWIETIRKDDSVRAVVVRINSPGGGVTPSQEIYNAVKRLSADKPVVVSMSTMAASGGYYIALGGREIFANPSTLTASIGVKLQLANLEGLMEHIGISETTLTTGDLKDAGSYSRPMTPEERAYFQALLDDMFVEFLETICRERDLPMDYVRTVADGRAMTGRQALQARLVDRLGDYQEALARAIALSDLEPGAPPQVIQGPPDDNPLLDYLVGSVMRVQASRKAASAMPVFMY